MLDILLSRLKEEIAIDGSSGSSIDTVWEYVEILSKDIAQDSGAAIAPLVDDKYKSFIWNYLRAEKDLDFYENIAPVEAQEQTDTIIESGTATNNDSSNMGIGEEVGPSNGENVSNTDSTDVTMTEKEADVIDTIRPAAATPETPQTKRKQPPKSEKKAAPPKKKAKGKAKAKPKPKKKASRKTLLADSDDDFGGGDASEGSESESEFEDDASEEEEDDSDVSEAESEEYDSEEEDRPKKKKTNAVAKQAKKENVRPAKKTVQKPNLNRVDDVSELNYEQVTEKYGNRLYITGSLELQEKQLYAGIPPGASLSPNLTIILQEIIRARSRGLYQANITKILGIDSRSTGHYCKSLEEKGAVVRKGISINGMRTNVCIHTKFTAKDQIINIEDDHEDDVPYNVNSKGRAYSQESLRDSMLELIKDAPEQAILGEDVLRALGFNYRKRAVRKWFSRSVEELCGKGYIKKSNVKVKSIGQIRRCLHLVKMPETSAAIEELPTDAMDFPLRIKSIKKDIPILHILVDSSLESQCLQVLAAAGENGATQKELAFALNMDESRILYKLMEKMCELTGLGLERFGAMRVLEFEGKQRRYRYYTYAAYKKVHENIEVDLPALPEQDMDESRCHDRNYLIDIPHTNKEYSQFISAAAKNASANNNIFSVTGRKVVDKPAGKLGRPRKTPVPPPKPEREGPVKRGRPKKAVSDTEPAKKRKYTPRKPKEAPAAATVAPADSSTTESAPINEVLLDEGSSTANPIPIEDSEPLLNSYGLPNGVTPEQLGFVPSSSSTATAEGSNIQKMPAAPIISESTEVAIDSESAAAASAPPESMDIDTPSSSTAAKEIVPPLSLRSAPEKSTKQKVTTKKATGKKVAASTPPPPAHNLRNRTIADYFSKASNKVAATTKEPKGKNKADESQPTEAMDIYAPVEPSAAPQPGSIKQPATTETPIAEAIEASKADVPNNEAVPSAEEVANPVEEITVPEEEVTTPATKATGPEKDITTPITEDAALTESSPAPAESDKQQNANAPEAAVESSPTATTETPATTDRQLRFKNGTKHRITNTPKQVNIYMEARAKVLLAILEESAMVDLGKDLMDLYIKKATEMSGPPKYSIDSRTLWRSAQLLSDRGQAKLDIIDCRLLSGKTVQRKILLRNDVDMESEEYKTYVQFMQERRAIQVTYGASRKYENIDMPIERLEERIPRMREELQQLLGNGKTKEAKLLQRRIDELSKNVAQFHPTDGKGRLVSWMITAIQFGWIHARMLRVKMLYTYLFGLFDRQETLPGVDKENREISTSCIISNMPLRLVLQIIGIFELKENVMHYIREANHQHLTYKEMPESISSELFSDKNKFRRRLRNLFYGLEFLDLVEAKYPSLYEARNTGKYANLGSSYHLYRTVAIKERHKLGQPVLREHTLDSSADATLFWSELQYVCTKLAEDIPKEECEPEPSHPFAAEFWSGLYHVRNWSSSSVYTRAQRKVLNSHVDKVNGTTPIDNLNTIQDIADQLDMTIASVRAYFNKVEAAIARKNKHMEMRKVERRLYPMKRGKRLKRRVDNDGRRVINLSSTRAFRPTTRKLWNFSAPQTTEESETLTNQHNQSVADQRARGENLYLDDVGDVPVLSNNTHNLRISRSKRTYWTEQENELFIYAYVILRQRAVKTRFLWSAVHSKIFPNKQASRFRQHLQHILLNPVYVEQIESAAKYWSQFYQEGLDKGDIQDPNPRDLVNFDILGHLAYFLDRLSNKDGRKKDVHLPKTIDDLKDKLEVTRVADTHPYFFEDRYYSTGSLAGKMSALYHQSFSARRLYESAFDTPEQAIIMENQIEERQRKIIKSYSLMCLLTPSERYDPLFSYSVLSSFPRELQDEVMKEMRTEGTLIGCKGDRPVPGTRFGLSSKFTTSMSGKLPKHFFQQAREYDKYLNQLGKNRFMADVVSSGMMGCILSLLSDNKLNVTMANKSMQMEKCETMTFNSRRTDRSLTIFELDIEKTESEDLTGYDLAPEELKMNPMNHDELEVEFSNFLNLQEEHIKPLCREIIDLLQAQKDTGYSLYNIKSRLKTENDDATIKRAIHLLSTHTPTLICPVGFDATRYILAIYTSTWTIHTKEIINQFGTKFKNKMKAACAQQNTENIERKDTIVTNIWTDVNGDTTNLVLKDVKSVLVDYILRRPGSSEATIHRHFNQAFNRKELHDILELLVKQDVLKTVSIIQPIQLQAGKSVFAKSHALKCTTNQVIERSTQSCYWVTATTYRSIS